MMRLTIIVTVLMLLWLLTNVCSGIVADSVVPSL
jgi:hypothetical protein